MTGEVSTQGARDRGGRHAIEAGDTHRVIEAVTQKWTRQDNILKCQLVLTNVCLTLLYEVRTHAIRRWVGIRGRLYVAVVLIDGGPTRLC